MDNLSHGHSLSHPLDLLLEKDDLLIHFVRVGLKGCLLAPAFPSILISLEDLQAEQILHLLHIVVLRSFVIFETTLKICCLPDIFFLLKILRIFATLRLMLHYFLTDCTYLAHLVLFHPYSILSCVYSVLVLLLLKNEILLLTFSVQCI